MATISQVGSGSTSSTNSIPLTGINVSPGDWLFAISSSYQGYAAWYSTTLPIGVYNGNINYASNPDLHVYTHLCEISIGVTGGAATFYTLSNGPSTIIMYKITPDEGKQLILRESSFASNNATSISLSSSVLMTPETILIGGGGAADNTYFTDTDTTDGSWSPVYTAFSTAGNDIGAFGQSKIVTGSSVQTYGGSWATGTSEVGVIFLTAWYEVPRPYWGMEAL